MPKCRVLLAGPITSQETLNLVLEDIQTKYLLLLAGDQQILIEPRALERLLQVAESTNAGIVYSDFNDETEHGKLFHPLIDYQPGSVRDDFDFGAMILLSVPAVREAFKKYGATPAVKYAGIYDLRLKVSIDHAIHHITESLYSVTKADGPSGDQRRFSYVDPRNEAVQKEMEAVFTDYLKKIGAYLPPHHLREVERGSSILSGRSLCRYPGEEPERNDCRCRKKRPFAGNRLSLSTSSSWTITRPMGQRKFSPISPDGIRA